MSDDRYQMSQSKFTKPKKGRRGPAAALVEVTGLVEVIGLEPTTPCLQSRRSPS